MITNKVTKKRYVGKSHDLLDRIKDYLSKDYLTTKHNSNICKALLSFGYSNFSITILEHCQTYKLRDREQHFINELKPQYNIRKVVKRLQDVDKNK